MSTSPEEQDPSRSLLCAVIDGGEIALVRVVGRGNFGNSMALKRFAAQLHAQGKPGSLIVDLSACDSMDSTFMGVLAGICITQMQSRAKAIVLNANDHCRRLLKNLGLTHLVDMRAGQIAQAERAEASLAPARPVEASRLEQICLTLQAHKELVRLDEQNEIRFQAVIEYLEKSLDQSKSFDRPQA